MLFIRISKPIARHHSFNFFSRNITHDGYTKMSWETSWRESRYQPCGDDDHFSWSSPSRKPHCYAIMNNQYLYELYGVSSNRSSDTEHANFWQTCSCVSFRGYHSNHFDGYYGNQGSDAIDDVGLKDEPYLIFWSDGGSSLSRSQFNWDYIFFFCLSWQRQNGAIFQESPDPSKLRTIKKRIFLKIEWIWMKCSPVLGMHKKNWDTADTNTSKGNITKGWWII